MPNDSPAIPHQLILDDRRRLSLSGVSDVDSFDDRAVIAHTTLGDLAIKGCDLKICRLNTETGDLSLEGHIDTLEYSESKPRTGTLRRWFR